LATAEAMFQAVGHAINDEQLRLNYISAETNITIKNYLLRCGVRWQDEYNQLVERLTQGYTTNLTWSDEQKTEFFAWNYRISLKILVSTYEVCNIYAHLVRSGDSYGFQTFSGDCGKISNQTRDKIDDYFNNATWSLQVG
jgi:hypothetical protein